MPEDENTPDNAPEELEGTNAEPAPENEKASAPETEEANTAPRALTKEQVAEIMRRREDTLVEFIAEACHKANQRYKRLLGEPLDPEWHDASGEFKDSVRDGVRFLVKDKAATPTRLHKNWFERRRAAGWRYSKLRSDSLKLHPCMKAYLDLPPEQQAKDLIFWSIARAILEEQEDVMPMVTP